jgi:hypothetical protein
MLAVCPVDKVPDPFVHDIEGAVEDVVHTVVLSAAEVVVEPKPNVEVTVIE